MELNNINNASLNDVSTLTNTMNLNSLNSTQKVDGNITNSFAVDSQLNLNKSDLSNSLKDFTKQISKSQIDLQAVNEQSNILNNIQELTNKLVSSNNVAQTEIEVQPAIETLMAKYNTSSTNTVATLQEFQAATDSSAYFDGKLGARPLSTSEILDAVDKQMSLVNQQKEFTSNEIQKAEKRALNTIGKEIELASAKAPFEPIDFGKDIGNFSSANINNVLGSVATSQANAIPSNSPKLLA